MSPPDFQLQADPPRMTSGELARRFGVSSQTISNWRSKGMPVEQSDRGYLYDHEACDQWRSRNTGGSGHGGRRPNSGRKRSRVPPDRRLTSAVDIANAKSACRERQADFIHVDDLLQITYGELLTLVALEVEESGLDKAKLERLKLLLDARSKRTDELVKEGKLVDAEAVAAAMAERMGRLREKIDQLPARLVRGVMLALGADRSAEPAVLAAMTEQVDAVLGEISGESSKAEKQQSSK